MAGADREGSSRLLLSDIAERPQWDACGYARAFHWGFSRLSPRENTQYGYAACMTRLRFTTPLALTTSLFLASCSGNLAGAPGASQVTEKGSIELNLMENPTSFAAFTHQESFVGAVTGTVKETRSEVSGEPKSVSTVATVTIDKTTGAPGLDKDSSISVKFVGGRATKGELYAGEEGKDGDEASSSVSPDDKTPVVVAPGGAEPPRTGDEILLFLGRSEVTKDVWLPVSHYRGVYVLDEEATRNAGDGEQIYARRGDVDVASLATVTVARLNDIFAKQDSSQPLTLG